MPHTLPQCAHLPPRTPRGFGRRARHETGHPLKPRCRFQWGQRLSALDTDNRHGGSQFQLRASMGPTPFSVGYQPGGKNELQGDNPSMWPTPFSVGYTGMRTLTATGRMSFNGANAFQRWIPRNETVTIHLLNDLQWGPTPFSVGYTTLGTTNASSTTCFNGANAFQRWIRPRGVVLLPLHSRFNGDNAFQRWILPAEMLAASDPYKLQWGQRLSALDTAYHGIRAYRCAVASMGPTPFSVGYISSM